MVKAITQDGNWKWLSIIVTIVLAAASIVYAAGGFAKDIESNSNEIARVNVDGCKPSKLINNKQSQMSVQIEGMKSTDVSQDISIFHIQEVARDTEKVLTVLKTESKRTQQDVAEIKADLKEVLREIKSNNL